jgi:hypothetical protein
MGLLDDAIREHLDLKRARGGDPAEIEKMEREALGPVRREPTIGSTRLEAGDEHAVLDHGGGYPDDRDQLLDPGYHDSTAPHPHPHHEQPRHDHLGHEREDHLGHEYEDPFDERADAQEQPKRRFLRRSRSASQSDFPSAPSRHEDALLDPHGVFGPGDPLEQHDLEHHEAVDHHEPLEHHELSEHHESLAHHDLHQHHETLEHGEPPAAPGADADAAAPPHLQFDQPPKRPRFSPEPPSAQPPSAQDAGEVQETTEFDVQQHIAETRLQADTETQVHHPVPPPGPPAAEEEDVLEETPEFLQDTPEHDRLWFEQRPPRDFDFDG